MRKIGFVGYGAMAQLMSARLRDAGFSVSAFDLHHAGEMIDGVPMLSTAREIAETSDAVLISVPADEALDASTSGHDGVIEGARPGLLVIDLSSVSPAASRALAARGTKAGLRVVDAPVSGSTPEAERGELVVLAGGSADDVAFAAPILDAIGKKTVHVGPAGQGATMKLAINAIMGMGLAAVAEAVAYGIGAGLERDVVFATLADLAVVSPHHARKLKSAASGDFEAQFPTRLMHKDMGLVLADAASHAIPMPSTAAASQLFSAAMRHHANDDYAVAIAVMEAVVRD